MNQQTILVVEDDAAVRRGIVDALHFAGYLTLEAADGAEGIRCATKATYQLMLLDLVMPYHSGFEVLQALKKQRPGQAVIILSARGEESDRVQGLRMGADDYVLKPFSVKELLARVEAVMRRSCERVTVREEATFSFGTVDYMAGMILFKDGGTAEISAREADLLRYLISASGRAVSREELLRHVWNLETRGMETRTIDMHIAHLRTKLRDVEQTMIVTVRGKGYRWSAT